MISVLGLGALKAPNPKLMLVGLAVSGLALVVAVSSSSITTAGREGPLDASEPHGWSNPGLEVGETYLHASIRFGVSTDSEITIEQIELVVREGSITLEDARVIDQRPLGGAYGLQPWPPSPAEFGTGHLRAEGAKLTRPLGSQGDWLLLLAISMHEQGNAVLEAVDITYEVDGKKYTERSYSVVVMCTDESACPRVIRPKEDLP